MKINLDLVLKIREKCSQKLNSDWKSETVQKQSNFHENNRKKLTHRLEHTALVHFVFDTVQLRTFSSSLYTSPKVIKMFQLICQFTQATRLLENSMNSF